MTTPAPEFWPLQDGSPVSCREKLNMLAENEAELIGVMQDAFEDAILMGVDETFLRARFAALATRLKSPVV